VRGRGKPRELGWREEREAGRGAGWAVSGCAGFCWPSGDLGRGRGLGCLGLGSGKRERGDWAGLGWVGFSFLFLLLFYF
jgi:hypothetical protein